MLFFSTFVIENHIESFVPFPHNHQNFSDHEKEFYLCFVLHFLVFTGIHYKYGPEK